MSNLRIIGNVTFPPTALGTVAATVPGLVVLAYYGTILDNININRIATGPVLTPSATPPTLSSNYMTFGGTNGTTKANALVTQKRDSAALASGWSVMVAARVPASGNPSTLWSDFAALPAILRVQNNPSGGPNIGSSVVALDAPTSQSAAIVMGAAGIAQSWRMYGMSYSGGGTGGTFSVYDVSGNVGLDVTGVTGVVASANNMQEGYNASVGPTNFGSSDQAFFLLALSYLNLAAQRVIYSSVKTALARRGVVVV